MEFALRFLNECRTARHALRGFQEARQTWNTDYQSTWKQVYPVTHSELLRVSN